METRKTAIGGCCMGIPFGCSSILLLYVGAGLWQHTGSAWFLLAAILPSVIASLIGLAAAIQIKVKRLFRLNLPVSEASRSGMIELGSDKLLR